jgi:hypothetical protein
MLTHRQCKSILRPCMALPVATAGSARGKSEIKQSECLEVSRVTQGQRVTARANLRLRLGQIQQRRARMSASQRRIMYEMLEAPPSGASAF